MNVNRIPLRKNNPLSFGARNWLRWRLMRLGPIWLEIEKRRPARRMERGAGREPERVRGTEKLDTGI